MREELSGSRQSGLPIPELRKTSLFQGNALKKKIWMKVARRHVFRAKIKRGGGKVERREGK